MTKTATQRDVTKILKLAKSGASKAMSHWTSDDDPWSELAALFVDIGKIALAIDARTGRRDPSVRKKGKSAGRKRVTR